MRHGTARHSGGVGARTEGRTAAEGAPASGGACMAAQTALLRCTKQTRARARDTAALLTVIQSQVPQVLAAAGGEAVQSQQMCLYAVALEGLWHRNRGTARRAPRADLRCLELTKAWPTTGHKSDQHSLVVVSKGDVALAGGGLRSRQEAGGRAPWHGAQAGQAEVYCLAKCQLILPLPRGGTRRKGA